METQVTIYTDGAAEPNPGPGGYGVILIAGRHRKELSGGFKRTTNNRMELMAVIVGIEALKRHCIVTVVSDSKYVVDSIRNDYVTKWKANSWRSKDCKRTKNADLWERYLTAAASHTVELEWIKGHSGHPQNERCDQLALAATRHNSLTIDQGYLDEIKLQEAGKKFEGASRTHCHKCDMELVKKIFKEKKLKPGQTYYFEWALVCPACKTIYLSEAAKRFV